MSHVAVDKSLSVVPETRFGRWFLRTNIWTRYVVEAALDEFMRQLPATLERPRRILDAGCGAGVSLPLLDQRLRPDCIVALDIEPGEVERCRRQARGCRSELRLMVGDAANLALADESVDIVLCHQMLHHARRQEAILREFHRALVPGGWLLLAESCRSFILSTPVRMMFRHPNEVQKSAGEYQELVRAAGFSFGPTQVATSTPFWSLLDWGLSRRVGWRANRPLEPTQVTLSATKTPAFGTPR